MSSTEKQLLGTETARNLRAKGVKEPIICGLSANDIEFNFLRNGADAFLIKPLPCNQDDLTETLVDLLKKRGDKYKKLAQEQSASGHQHDFDMLTAEQLNGEASPHTTSQPESATAKISPLFKISPTNSSSTATKCGEGNDTAAQPTPLFSIAPQSPSKTTGSSPQKAAPLFDMNRLSTTSTSTPTIESKASPLLNIPGEYFESTTVSAGKQNGLPLSDPALLSDSTSSEAPQHPLPPIDSAPNRELKEHPRFALRHSQSKNNGAPLLKTSSTVSTPSTTETTK